MPFTSGGKMSSCDLKLFEPWKLDFCFRSQVLPLNQFLLFTQPSWQEWSCLIHLHLPISPQSSTFHVVNSSYVWIGFNWGILLESHVTCPDIFLKTGECLEIRGRYSGLKIYLIVGNTWRAAEKEWIIFNDTCRFYRTSMQLTLLFLVYLEICHILCL